MSCLDWLHGSAEAADLGWIPLDEGSSQNCAGCGGANGRLASNANSSRSPGNSTLASGNERQPLAAFALGYMGSKRVLRELHRGAKPYQRVPPMNQDTDMQGAEAPLSGLIAMLTAAEILGNSTLASRYERRLVFAAFAGEPWGYMGSKRFLWELHSRENSTKPLTLKAIDQVGPLCPLSTCLTWSEDCILW